MKKAIEYRGWREPDKQEIKRISKIMEKRLEKDIRLCKRFMYIALILGVFFIYGIFIQEELIMKLVVSFLVILCAFGFIYAFKTKSLCNKEILLYKKGLFKVLDGSAGKTTSHYDLPGVTNVTFISNSGVEIGEYELNNKELENSDHILLACIPDYDSPTGKEICHAFSMAIEGKYNSK